jgi:predicted nucleic-acid-binding protein
MIAVDTNVLVRLVMRDDEAQAQRAHDLFEQQAALDQTLFVTDHVLAELGWVLKSRYGQGPEALSRTVRALLGNATVALQSPDAVRAAVDLLDGSGGDFADCLLAALAQRHGCEAVATFDRGMRALPGVRLL